MQEVQLHDLTREVISDELPREYLHEEKPVNSPELPLMRLEVIYVATSNFSDANKLGQGGFGPVYKAILASRLSVWHEKKKKIHHSVVVFHL